MKNTTQVATNTINESTTFEDKIKISSSTQYSKDEMIQKQCKRILSNYKVNLLHPSGYLVKVEPMQLETIKDFFSEKQFSSFMEILEKHKVLKGSRGSNSDTPSMVTLRANFTKFCEAQCNLGIVDRDIDSVEGKKIRYAINDKNGNTRILSLNLGNKNRKKSEK